VAAEKERAVTVVQELQQRQEQERREAEARHARYGQDGSCLPMQRCCAGACSTRALTSTRSWRWTATIGGIARFSGGQVQTLPGYHSHHNPPQI
jgi:hypothetical protein